MINRDGKQRWERQHCVLKKTFRVRETWSSIPDVVFQLCDGKLICDLQVPPFPCVKCKGCSAPSQDQMKYLKVSGKLWAVPVL